MRSLSKAAVWTSAGIVGGGAAAGIAYAAVATPAAAGQNPTTTAAAQRHLQRLHPGAGFRGRGLLQHLEHGQLTLQTRHGERTVDLQRGKVDKVAPTSITVVSPDGFTRTYTVTSTTRVRGAHGRGAITDVHAGDKVLVVATAGTAVRIADR